MKEIHYKKAGASEYLVGGIVKDIRKYAHEFVSPLSYKLDSEKDEIIESIINAYNTNSSFEYDSTEYKFVDV